MVRLSLRTLQWIGLILVSLRSFSIAVLQRGVLKLDNDGAMDALNEAMKPGGGVMGWVTGAVLCSLLAALSIPLFAKVAYESWKRAKGSKRYFTGLVLCALISEIPYDFAMSGKLVDWSAQNPVWGLLLAVIALELLRPWRPRSVAGNILFKAVVTFAALAWALLLRVHMGPLLVLLTALFCFAEKREIVSLLGGVLLTLLQFPAPIGMVFVNWYDENKDGSSSKLFCLLYPVQLAIFGLLGMLLA